jgi:hypothetical protein
MPIQAITLSMMHTGSSQMGEPSDGQKEDQQKPIQALAITHQAGFQVPTTALAHPERWIPRACAVHIP